MVGRLGGCQLNRLFTAGFGKLVKGGCVIDVKSAFDAPALVAAALPAAAVENPLPYEVSYTSDGTPTTCIAGVKLKTGGMMARKITNAGGYTDDKAWYSGGTPGIPSRRQQGGTSVRP